MVERAGMSTPGSPARAALASVTYTIPASASPRATLLTTALTSGSWLAGVTVTPAACRAWLAYRPQGTDGAQSRTISPARLRSASPPVCRGLPGGTTIWGRVRGEDGSGPGTGT